VGHALLLSNALEVLMLRRCSALPIALLALLLAADARASCDLSDLSPGSEVAELETAVGTLCIELLRDDAPLHVANFLFYLQNGQLVDTFFHRSVPGFVFQGGGFTLGASDYEAVPALNGTVTNEPCTLDIPDPMNPGGQICSERGNERGTVALAKLGGDPNSGSTNWFINLVDNRSNLDNANGGFTVFGRLVSGSIAVADALAALPIATGDDIFWSQSAFTSFSLPLLAPPLATPFGCWDRAMESTALVAASLGGALQAWADPVLPGFAMQLSAGCGTAIPIPSSAADLPPDSCPNPGGVVIRTTGPLTLLFPGDVQSYFSLTCAEVQESLDERALWLAAYQAHFDQQLVFIESATLQTLPVSVPALSLLAALLLSGLVLGAGLRALRGRLTHFGLAG
jgi:cyclophilin family peptidyl-prolyl cis-trans isomerase